MNLAALPPLLLPRPRSLEMREGRASAAIRSERISEHEPLRHPDPEAYALFLTLEGASIHARTPQGARHARRTLAQLKTQYRDTPPALNNKDAPAFPTRGVMLDISRDRVPTMEHLLSTADLLGSLKINHLQLYTEHTFAYAGHEEVWRDASPMTPEEVRTLDARCLEHGIDLAANQNCFGHLATWLRRPRYAHLAETHGDWTFAFRDETFARSGPFSLCPTDPASLEFAQGLLRQLLPCFSGGLVNIGCDETFDVGAGRSREEVARRGRGAVSTDFVTKVADAARRLGKRPMFWADIALSQPECLATLPNDMIGLAWDYEPDSEWSRWCTQIREAGLEAWVCPGTSSWRSITGRTTERRANLQRAARDGLAHGATGYLVTDWGDMGHHQQWPIALVALAEAADAAWTGGRDGYDPRAASLHAFGDRPLELAPWLDRLGDADEPLRRVAGPSPDGSPAPLRNSTALFSDLHTPLVNPPDDRRARALRATPLPLWEATVDRIQSLASEPQWARTDNFHDEIDLTIAVGLLASRKALFRRAPVLDRTHLADYADAAAEVLASHRRLWLRRSRPGGLELSCAHYQRIIDDLRSAAAR